MKILYIQHVGILGGSGRSLYELISQVIKDEDVKATIVCPDGKLSGMFKDLGLDVITVRGLSNFDNNRYSYYRGLRWLILLREIALLLPTIILFLRLKLHRNHFDIIHINEITMPVVGILGNIFFRNASIVVHSRAVQRNIKNWRSKTLGALNRRIYDKVICIDETVSKSFPYEIDRIIVHNGLQIPANESLPNIEYLNTTGTLRIGMVGSLHVSKGSLDLLKAAKLLIDRDRFIDCEFLFYGAVPRIKNGIFSKTVKAFKLQSDTFQDALRYVEDYDLHDLVRFLPFEADLEKIYRSIDIICFPSLLDAPGRPIFEAGVYGKPAIVCLSEPESNTFLPGVVGELVTTASPICLAETISMYLNDQNKLKTQKANCNTFYKKRFDIKLTSSSTYNVYKSLLIKRI